MRDLGGGNRLNCEASFYALYSDSLSGTEEDSQTGHIPLNIEVVI